MLGPSHATEPRSEKLMGEVTWTFKDYGQEKSPFKVTTADPVAAGFDTWNSQIAALLAAVGDIADGLLVKQVRSSYAVDESTALNTVETSQRERKWLVTYRDTVTEKLYRAEIPCAVLTGHLLPASDEADLTETDMAAFVSAFQTVVRSPDDPTNTVEVVSIRHVGRNI